jgi:1-acyl-sn-glycerol-3-phosphate acyltransferase
MKRATLLAILKKLTGWITDIEYYGLENIPKEGGLIITLNHISYLDSVVLIVNPVRSDLTALVTDKYQKNPIFRYFINSAEGIWIDRTKADFAAFKVAIEVLKQGKVLGVAPEGTRSKTGQLNEGKPGTVLLTMKTNVPILPVGVIGTEDGFSKLKRFQKPKMVANFGKPYHLPPMTRENKETYMQDCTEEIMCQIAALLPESYRGFYANHARVKELLAEQQG